MESAIAAPIVRREAGPADIGPIHWLARRRNEFILSEDALVLVETGSFQRRVAHIPIGDIEHVTFSRRLSGSRVLFGTNILVAALCLLASQYLQFAAYGAAWFLHGTKAPLVALLLTFFVAIEAIVVLLHANVSEVHVQAQGVEHRFLCSGVRAEDVERLHGLRDRARGAGHAS